MTRAREKEDSQRLAEPPGNGGRAVNPQRRPGLSKGVANLDCVCEV